MKNLKRYMLFVLCLVFVGYGNITTSAKGIIDLNGSNSFNLNLKVLTDSSDNNVITSANNLGFEKKFQAKRKEINIDNTKLKLLLCNENALKIDDSNNFTGRGEISVLGKKYDFEAIGDLYATKTDDDKIAFIGPLQGYFDNKETDENQIILSVYYVPEEKKCVINVTLGITYGKKGNYATLLSFGESFSSLKGINDKVNKIRKDKHIEEESIIDRSEISPMDYGGVPTPQDVHLKGKSVAYNNSLYTSSYFQDEAKVNGMNKVYGKSAINYNNMLAYLRANYDPHSSIGNFGCFDNYIRLISTDPDFESTTAVVPSSGSKSFSLPIPFYYAPIGWQTISITVTTSSTTVEYAPCTGAPSGRLNLTKFSFFKSIGFGSEIYCSTSTPEYESKGIDAFSYYTFSSGVQYPKLFTVGCEGSFTLHWPSMFGGDYYGTFTDMAGGNLTITP